MNQTNKAIEVNLSSLLSLKAELLRKQAEVKKAKANQAASHVPKKLEKTPREEHVTQVKKLENGTKVFEHEDSALLEKSKQVLEAKAKFYDRMSRSGGKLNSDDNCLVLFNRKKQEGIDEPEEKPERNKSSSSSSCSESEDEKSDDDDEWVEYTDCLGRTRKCLRKDLESVKRRDAELKASMPERLDQTKANWMLDVKSTQETDAQGGAANSDDDGDGSMIGPLPPSANAVESIYNDGCSLMSKHDEQKANWERKEQENLDKSEVHYQDVFFDEARQHGVGYYAFSTDEEERRRQQQELLEEREKTVEEQERREAIRAHREKIIAERVLSAKNRIRARLGLPPLTQADEEKADEKETDTKIETKEDRKARRRAEKLEKKRQAEETIREQERQHHIRPWDKDKQGVKAAKDMPASSTEGFIAGETEWQYKPERLPLSQEQWNEQKRAERNPFFAPPTETPERPPKVKRTNFNATHMPPPASPASCESFPEPCTSSSFESFQTSKRQKPKPTFTRRSYQEDSNDLEAQHIGVAIPPPADLDDTGHLPPNAKRSKTHDELERSIEAGLRFLRDNSDKGTLSTKSAWTAKADY